MSSVCSSVFTVLLLCLQRGGLSGGPWGGGGSMLAVQCGSVPILPLCAPPSMPVSLSRGVLCHSVAGGSSCLPSEGYTVWPGRHIPEEEHVGPKLCGGIYPSSCFLKKASEEWMPCPPPPDPICRNCSSQVGKCPTSGTNAIFSLTSRGLESSWQQYGAARGLALCHLMACLLWRSFSYSLQTPALDRGTILGPVDPESPLFSLTTG